MNSHQLFQLHKQTFRNCQLCSIGNHRKVFFRGSLPCRHLLIGEAPGPSERVLGKPFVGRAGKLLDALIADVGLTDYGIANVIACFPSDPDFPTRFRKPTPEEIANCKDRLDDLVETVEPQYYIALGKVAKTNPPTGVTYNLELDHPSFIERQGGKQSNAYKRNRHRLRKFLEEINGTETQIN